MFMRCYFFTLFLIVSACGGGGSDSDSINNPFSVVDDDLLLQRSVLAGKTFVCADDYWNMRFSIETVEIESFALYDGDGQVRYFNEEELERFNQNNEYPWTPISSNTVKIHLEEFDWTYIYEFNAMTHISGARRCLENRL